MAKLPAVVTEIAKVDGRDRATVDHIARTIRERGYITTGKRGGGAVEMTTREVVNLLIALNGAETPKEAPLAIDRFRSLRQSISGTSKDIRAHLDRYETHLKPIQDVMDVHTFGEALEALVDGVPELVEGIRNYAHRAYEGLDKDRLDRQLFRFMRLGVFGVSITFRRYHAAIELYTMIGSERRVEFKTTFEQDADRILDGFYGPGELDRFVTVTIGTPTLIAAYVTINPHSEIAGLAGDDPS